MKPRSRDIAKLEKRLSKVEEPVSEDSSEDSDTEKKDKEPAQSKKPQGQVELPKTAMNHEDIAKMHQRQKEEVHKLKEIFQKQNRALRHNALGFGDDQGPKIVEYPKLPTENDDPEIIAAGGEKAYFAAVFK